MVQKGYRRLDPLLGHVVDTEKRFAEISADRKFGILNFTKNEFMT